MRLTRFNSSTAAPKTAGAPAPVIPVPAGQSALGRLPNGHMNKTEEAYASLLSAKREAGEVLWFSFEGMKFRLADATFYTPDFMVMLANGQLQAHEVKGQWQDAARIKIKIAASLHPIQFIAVKAPRRKADGWQIEEF